jgi:hypothetical protein
LAPYSFGVSRTGNVFGIRFRFQVQENEANNSKKLTKSLIFVHVTDSGEGVCVDPGEKEAILEAGGPGPPGEGKGEQLASDSGGG